MKLALVTGASRGFGNAISLELAKQNYYVVGAARNEELLKELTKKTKGSYFVFDGYDIDSIIDLGNKILGMNKDYDSLDVIVAADQHEDVSIIENNKKRFTNEDDFSKEYKKNAHILTVGGPLNLYNTLRNKGLSFNLFYISSQAAQRAFWNMGNSIYGPNKAKTEELLVDFSNVSSLRFPFLDTEMADKMYEQLTNLDGVVHVDYDINKPLKHKKEVFLPVKPVASDVVNYLQGDRKFFDNVMANVYSYNKTVEDFK